MDEKPRQRTNTHKLPSIVQNESDALQGALQLAEQRAADTQAALFVALQSAKREGLVNLFVMLGDLVEKERVTLTTITQAIETLRNMRKA